MVFFEQQVSLALKDESSLVLLPCGILFQAYGDAASPVSGSVDRLHDINQFLLVLEGENRFVIVVSAEAIVCACRNRRM